jgi:E3 ubiquitin-protein ligase RNF220
MLTQLYTRSITRRRAAPHSRDASVAFASRLAKTLSSIKRRRRARYIALRDVTRDEDDLSVVGKGKGRATTTAEQCPVCLQDVDGDLDVIAAHIDACLAHAELQRPASSIDADADGDVPLNIEGYGEDDSDMWEESETPDGVRRLRLRAGARNGAIALGFAVGDRTVDDVDDEIDVEGDDLSAFGAANFTEVDILAEPCDSELSRPDTGRLAAEVEVDMAIERARHGKDSQALIAALESKVQLLVVRQHTPYRLGRVHLLIRALGSLDGWWSVGVSHLSRGIY